MTNLQLRLYARIVQLHPADFSDRFGREMMLDFADASATSAFAPLCLDALLSLGRQWTASALHDTAEQVQTRKLSLLAGDYVMISPGGPSPFNIARASVLASLLLFVISSALSTASRHIIDLPVGSGSQAQGFHSSAQHRPYGAGNIGPTTTTHRTAIEVLEQPTGRLAPHSEAEASSQNTGSIGASVIDPELKKYLWQLAAFIEFVWLLALLLYKRPSIGRKVALAVFGLLAFAAPMTFAAAPAALLLAEFAQPQPHPELLLSHPSTPLSYEVATIKPLDPEAAAGMIRLPPGASLSPLSIRRYLMDAYGATYAEQIVGGPDWLNKDAYLIHGKVPDDLEAVLQNMPYQQRIERNRAMQQSLLANRFHLTAHFETRILPVYELVPAKGGLKLTEVPAPPEHKPGDQPAPPRPGDKLPPGTSVSTFNSNGLHVLNGRAIKLDLLARIVGVDAGDRPIVNHTGFTGCFDVTNLTWAPLNEAVANGTLDAPSLSVAMERTLGIRIAPTKAPIEVLVIDRIERPSEN